MRKDDLFEMADLGEKRETLAGLNILNHIIELKTSRDIEHKNYDDLNEFILKNLKNHTLIAIKNYKEYAIFRQELLRLLHNYLASITTLRDISRNIKKKLNENIKNHYDFQIKTMNRVNYTIKFLQDLRNYTLHRNLPNIGIHFSAKRNSENEMEIKQIAYLPKKDLLEWENWSHNSKKFIERYQKEQLDLSEIINNYHSTIIGFTNLLIWSIRDEYKTELNELEKLNNRMKELTEKLKK